MAPKTLTEALILAKYKADPTNAAAKQMVQDIIARREEHSFKTDAYHAAPKTEMY